MTWTLCRPRPPSFELGSACSFSSAENTFQWISHLTEDPVISVSNTVRQGRLTQDSQGGTRFTIFSLLLNISLIWNWDTSCLMRVLYTSAQWSSPYKSVVLFTVGNIELGHCGQMQRHNFPRDTTWDWTPSSPPLKPLPCSYTTLGWVWVNVWDPKHSGSLTLKPAELCWHPVRTHPMAASIV
jgi:hypothetical protein